MTDALVPRFTPLDERVLALVPDEQPGVRARVIHRKIAGPPSRWRKPGAVTPSDIRLILRGLEHLDRTRNRHGWWTRR